jgi:YVTN family beta-propeller protein
MLLRCGLRTMGTTLTLKSFEIAVKFEDWLPIRQRFAALILCGMLCAHAPARDPGATQTIDRPSKIAAGAKDYDHSWIGPTSDGRVMVPTNQILSPAGRQVVVSARPTDVALSPDQKWLAVLNMRDVQLIDVETGKIVSHVTIRGGSFNGILFAPDGKKLYASSMKGGVLVAQVSDGGKLSLTEPIDLPARRRGDNTVSSGLAISSDGKTLFTALNLKNKLAVIDLAKGELKREIAVGNAPYDVVLAGDRAYVSNWAGRLPTEESPTGPSGGLPPVRVDPVRNIANDGSVSIVDLKSGKQIAEVIVGLHPSGMAVTPNKKYVVVANASSDTLSVIDSSTQKVVETISTRPAKRLPFGSAPNAVVFSANGRRLYASNGTNNSIAVVEFSPPHSKLLGCMPTGWYPAGLAFDAKRNSLYIANIKGIGSRNRSWEGQRKVNGNVVFGYNSHDAQGTLTFMKLPSDDELANETQLVLTNNRLKEMERALDPPRADAKPRPVPERHGEPSVFKHVLYIIRENRTYDQVLGDVKKGEGDPSLCIFGEEVTPNAHKLVDEFVLLDNFNCSGVCSADGHQWTDEAYVTDYLEKAFAGWPRSYPYPGGDAMAYAPTGFLWDNVLAHKKTLRVYGEFTTAKMKWKDSARAGSPRWMDLYRDFLAKKGDVQVVVTPGIKTIEPYLCPTAAGFTLTIPDVHRAGQFIDELHGYEKKGELPNLMMMILPNDHTSGTRPGMPKPESAVADNDVSLGRIIEAVSHSKFWKDTCIFVVEDDPQMGFDHIDGHRTVALVVSPYTRRKVVDSTNYNQTSMVRTIELILGLPPMNQIDASATPMNSCFMDQPDLTPYSAVPNLVPLDSLNPEMSEIKDARARHWAEQSVAMNLDEVDKADENIFNRVLWHARRGRDDTYPSWAVTAEEDDDD